MDVNDPIVYFAQKVVHLNEVKKKMEEGDYQYGYPPHLERELSEVAGYLRDVVEAIIDERIYALVKASAIATDVAIGGDEGDYES